MPRVEPVDWIDLVGRELVLMGTQQSIVPDLTTNRDILSVRVGSEATPRYTVSLDTSGNVVHQISPNTANFIIQDGTGPRITITRNQVGIGTTTYATVGTEPRLHIGDLPADWVTWGQWKIAVVNPPANAFIARRTDTANFRLLHAIHNNTEGYQEDWCFEMASGSQAPLDVWALKMPGGVQTFVYPLRLSMDGWVRLGNYHYGGTATPIGAYLSGHLYAWADAVHDIGSADTSRFRDLYQTGTHFFRPANITSNRDILSVRVGSEANPRHKVLINTAGQLVFQSGPGGTTAPTDALTLPADTTGAVAINRGVALSGHVLFSIDGTWDIGQSGTNRPRHIYAWGDVRSGNWVHTFYGVQFNGGPSTLQLSTTIPTGYFTLRDITNSVNIVQWSLGNPAEGDTSMLLLTTRGGITSVQRVSLGAPDSGGAGYRLLRVPN